MTQKVLDVFKGTCTLIGLLVILSLAIWKGVEVGPAVWNALVPKVKVEAPPIADLPTTPTTNTKSK
ncbi:MAG: hypothetical protein EB060_01015 [Proteobacteria bacterium]|nr:hypothetical protein [Pseudomonadota bacterium]